MNNTTDIPVIDISTPSATTAREVLDAASKFGFLYIKNNNVIPQKDIDDMFELSRQFFHSPRELKSKYAIHSAQSGGKNRGWVTMKGESLDPSQDADPKEAFNIGEPTNPPQPLPPPLAASADLISRFQTSCHALCNTILTLLATALEIPESEGGSRWFADRHDQSKGPSGTIFRMLYYPPRPPPQAQLTTSNPTILAGAHSDYGSLTLLFRLPSQSPINTPSSSGLEVLTPQNTWSPVPINPSPSTLPNAPILINIGDLLSFWTRGMLRSTVHRVVGPTPSGERYSMAYFCHPLDDAKLEGVPSRVIQEAEVDGEEKGKNGPEMGEILTARQHLDWRLRVTYGLKE